jgi:hypothetical protein
MNFHGRGSGAKETQAMTGELFLRNLGHMSHCPQEEGRLGYWSHKGLYEEQGKVHCCLG